MYLIVDISWEMTKMRNTMPAPSPPLTPDSARSLQQLGHALRSRRKALRVNAVSAAEAAHLSRVTLHRIEKGEASVTAGAYAQAGSVLGLALAWVPAAGEAAAAPAPRRKGWLPARVSLADYPVLRQLAWHVTGDRPLTPREALAIYERHAHHPWPEDMTPEEQDLLDALRLALADPSSAPDV